MIEFLNNTMKLKWLPPYLWIGQHVDAFTILIKSKNDEDSEVNEININSTFRALETYQDSLTHHRKCTEFSFEIRAYDNIIGMLPKGVNVSGRYPEGNGFPSPQYLHINCHIFLSRVLSW